MTSSRYPVKPQGQQTTDTTGSEADSWTRKTIEKHTGSKITFENQTWRLPATLERYGIEPGKFILDAPLILPNQIQVQHQQLKNINLT
jgi:hypothetical protein